MKINNFDEEYLEELEHKELGKYKLRNKSKKLKESFAFEDLLSEPQRKQIIKYME